MSATKTQIKTQERTVSGKVKTTKGDIEGFNRGVWNYMKKSLKVPEETLIKMKSARIPAKIDGTWAYLFRYFNPDEVEKRGLTINDYESLNEHPELVLYEGYQVMGKGGDIIMKEADWSGNSLLRDKITSGSITDIGIVREKSAGQKFLSGFGRFLMMGGFLVILIVIVGIVAAISILTK